MSCINRNHQQKNQSDQPSLDSLQAGLFFLINQYTFRQCPKIAEKIVEHLDMLCRHSQIELLPAQNHLYSKMINLWRARTIHNADRAFENSHLH